MSFGDTRIEAASLFNILRAVKQNRPDGCSDIGNLCPPVEDDD